METFAQPAEKCHFEFEVWIEKLVEMLGNRDVKNPFNILILLVKLLPLCYSLPRRSNGA
jgi:hypothetical protein